MAHHDDSRSVSALVPFTAGTNELGINADHSDREHNECLPYPDSNFNEPVDKSFQQGLLCET